MGLEFTPLVTLIPSVLLGGILITLFIWLLLVNSKAKSNPSDEMNKKLDKIIDLLEKQTK